MGSESSIPLYWQNPYLKEVTCIIKKVKGKEIQLSQSLLYPGGGGQLPDMGVVVYNNEEYPISVARLDEEGIWYSLDAEQLETFEQGKEVIIKLDWERRYSFMKAHSAQHLLTRVLEKFYQCETLKANFEKNSFEIEVSKKLSSDQVFEAVEYANKIIYTGIETKSIIVNQEEYKQKYKQKTRGKTSDETIVRLIQLGGEEEFDLVCCGGIHVKNLNEVKGIILEYIKGFIIKLGIDEHAFEFANNQRKIMMSLENLTQKKDEKLVEMITNKLNNIDILQSANVKLLRMVFGGLQKWEEKIGNYSCVFLELQEVDRQTIISAVKEIPDDYLVNILGDNHILYIISSNENIPANEVIRKFTEITGKKGGGNKSSAQVFVHELDEPFEILRKIIKDF